MGTERKSRTREKKRRFMPRPLILPKEEVSWRPTGDWPEEVVEYLIAYARTGSRSGACRLIGRGTDWAYKLEEQYGDALTEQENAAYMSIVERIEQTLAQRATEEPGMPGVTSAIFLLKGAKPEKYAERQKMEHSGRIETTWLDVLADRIETDSSTD